MDPKIIAFPMVDKSRASLAPRRNATGEIVALASRIPQVEVLELTSRIPQAEPGAPRLTY